MCTLDTTGAPGNKELPARPLKVGVLKLGSPRQVVTAGNSSGLLIPHNGRLDDGKTHFVGSWPSQFGGIATCMADDGGWSSLHRQIVPVPPQTDIFSRFELLVSGIGTCCHEQGSERCHVITG